MAEINSTNQCPGCAKLQKRFAELEARLAELAVALAKANKNSSNSGTPPSSNVTNPPQTRKRGRPKKRQRGGQPGHARQTRQTFHED